MLAVYYILVSSPMQQRPIIKHFSDIQPQLFPRLHYFSRMLNSHRFVFRDDVQFVRNHKYPDGKRHSSFQVHTPVLGNDGDVLLNSQVKKKSGLAIKEQQISYDPDWRPKFLNMIEQFYRKSAHYGEIKEELSRLIHQPYETVGELNIQTTLWGLCRLAGYSYNEEITIEKLNALFSSEQRFPLENIALGSEISMPENSGPTERILHLCHAAGCSHYIAGGTAIDSYFELDKFKAADIAVGRQEWNCEPYPQHGKPQHGKTFTPNLSIIDLLANCSPEKAIELLTSNFSLDLS